MRTTKLALTSLLFAISTAALAEKVVITGEPVVLEEKNGVYVLPSDYSTTTSYNYVTLGGVKNVCYAEKQTTFGSLEGKMVTVDVNGKQTQWTCYAYTDEYFTTGQ